MNFELFRNTFESHLIFSTYDVKAHFPGFDFKRLVEWQNKGYIIKLINKWYYFPLFNRQNNSHLLAANSIYEPSYISLQTALSYYGLIPEFIFSITSLTSMTNADFDTTLGHFTYNHIKPSLMFGYKLMEFENPFIKNNENNRHIKIADIEKSILDYFYINADINTEKEILQVRIDTDVFESDVNLDKLYKYLSDFRNKALEKRISKLIKVVND